MQIESINIKGMNCVHCVIAVKKELLKLNLKLIDVSIGNAKIEYDESILSKKEIENAIIEAGYQIVN